MPHAAGASLWASCRPEAEPLGEVFRMNEEDGPRVGMMIAAVAIIVALVILIFFAIGYGFGRMFL